MNIGGVNLTDENVKEIIGEQHLVAIVLNRFLQRTQAELSKGYDMKITKLPDGRLILEPEGKELEVMQWMEQRLGGNQLVEQINTFLKQREAQKDYDELIELGKEIKELELEEREILMHEIRNQVTVSRAKKIMKGLG